MNLPPPRVVEVLGLLRDLSPDDARLLLAQVVATLDAAEVIALRASLPASAVLFLPSCVGAVTVMNEAPMPWEVREPAPALEPAPRVGIETGRIIRSMLASPARSRVRVAAAV